MSIIQHNFFSPTCCNPCLLSPSSTTNKLSTCLGCKLILYCSKDHQKLDWPIHRQFCRAVRYLLKEYKVNHVFAIAGPIRTKKDLSEVTVKVKCKLVYLLKRSLEYHEEELTSFPIMCAVCFSTKINKLYQCKNCNAVSYCCLEHEHEDAPNHKRECHQLKLNYCKFKIDLNYIFKVEPFGSCELLESDLQKAMAIMFGIKFTSDPTQSLSEYQNFSFVCDFSCIGTVSYCLKYLKNDQQFVKEFTIYVAGSTTDEIWFTPLHVKFFFACFPEILKLNIIFIGPEVPEEASMDLTTIIDNGRILFLTSFKGTLENYSKNTEKSLKPDLVVCFNCGFSENAQTDGPSDLWYRGIQHLMELPDIPILFTSYTCLEADCDLRALQQVVEDNNKKNTFRLKQIIEKQQNPYRDMMPLRYWHYNDPESIFFRNGYVQAVKVINETVNSMKK